MTISQPSRGEKYWDCRFCGYLLTDVQYRDAIFTDCPRCYAHLSTFQTVVIPTGPTREAVIDSIEGTLQCSCGGFDDDLSYAYADKRSRRGVIVVCSKCKKTCRAEDVRRWECVDNNDWRRVR